MPENDSTSRRKRRWEPLRTHDVVLPTSASEPLSSTRTDPPVGSNEPLFGFADYPRLRTLLRDLGLPFQATYLQRDVAETLNKNQRTIRDWSNHGKMSHHRWPSGGPYYTAQDLEDFLAACERKITRDK